MLTLFCFFSSVSQPSCLPPQVFLCHYSVGPSTTVAISPRTDRTSKQQPCPVGTRPAPWAHVLVSFFLPLLSFLRFSLLLQYNTVSFVFTLLLVFFFGCTYAMGYVNLVYYLFANLPCFLLLFFFSVPIPVCCSSSCCLVRATLICSSSSTVRVLFVAFVFCLISEFLSFSFCRGFFVILISWLACSLCSRTHVIIWFAYVRSLSTLWLIRDYFLVFLCLISRWQRNLYQSVTGFISLRLNRNQHGHWVYCWCRWVEKSKPTNKR